MCEVFCKTFLVFVSRKIKNVFAKTLSIIECYQLGGGFIFGRKMAQVSKDRFLNSAGVSKRSFEPCFH